MKKVLLLILCVSSFSVLAQQPAQARGDGERPQLTPEEIAAFKAKRVEAAAAEQQVADPAPALTGDQENFDEIMGSFSKLAMKFSEEDSSNREMFVYECKHVGGKAFSRALEPFLSVNGELSDCDDSDLVIISDEREHLEKLKKIAEAIDRPVRQVLVSASVVEFQITDGFEKDLSLQYNQFQRMEKLTALPGGAATDSILNSDFATRMMDAILPSGGNPASLNGSSSYMYYDPDEQTIFSAFLTFLETKGTARILSSPSLIMRRGHTGNILSGEDIPITESNVGSGGTSYSVEYKSVGIKLRVTPESIFEDRVVLEVSPEVSNIIRYEESAAGRNPVIAIRNASTMLEMNDTQMVSIGGLLREEKIETERRVPILGSIPLIGTLFRASFSEEIRSQLVIFLTVNIVDPAKLSVDTIDPSQVPDQLQERIDASHAAMPQQKRSFFRDLFRLFK
ncbi:MAG: type II and III secretion system protein [Kiritimatiellales bacterium]|nr:type II and III secretion system protein [Kiritimatiellota bacterium]MBL7012293.1 type II and III secretion system protein [Kiritimatiellales bacterium]